MNQLLRELIQKWEKEAQRLQDIAALGESPIESAEANAKADTYWSCSHQLTLLLKEPEEGLTMHTKGIV